MIHPCPELPLDKEAFVVGFSGGGGACEGIDAALGRNVDVAMNHDWEAIAMHTMNHPQTIHYLQDIWDVDPLKVWERLGRRRIGGGWMSPDCKHFSKAKGAALIDKSIRSLAWVLKMWARRGGGRDGAGPACPRVLYLENVEEFQTWGPLIAKRCPKTGRVVKKDDTVAAPGEHVGYHDQKLVPDPKRRGLYFRRLIADLQAVGGVAEWRELRACLFGAPTIRKRLYLIVRFDGEAIVWPESTHGEPESMEVQSGQLKPYVPIADCLDFSLPCPSIFLSKEQAKTVNAKRPLAPNTMARVAKGVDRFVLKAKRPFIVCLTHQGTDGVESVDEPARTVTGANRGERMVVSPVIANVANSKTTGRGPNVWSPEEPARTVTASPGFTVIAPVLAHAQHGGSVRPADAPMHTVAASPKDQNQVIAVHLTKFNTGSVGAPVDEPCPTVTANSFIKRPGGAAPLGVVSAFIARQFGTGVGAPAGEPARTIMADGGGKSQLVSAFLAQHNTGVVGHAATEPASTISATGSQQAVIGASLVTYYGSEADAAGVGDPGRTVTTKDRFGLVAPIANVHPLTPELEAGARLVAAFLREHGVEFDGEFATVEIEGLVFVIVDIGMRMLIPRELYRAQGFADSYIIDRGIVEKDGRRVEVNLTRTAQVRMVGNSVCPPVARALVRANQPELCEWRIAA